MAAAGVPATAFRQRPAEPVHSGPDPVYANYDWSLWDRPILQHEHEASLLLRLGRPRFYQMNLARENRVLQRSTLFLQGAGLEQQGPGHIGSITMDSERTDPRGTSHIPHQGYNYERSRIQGRRFQNAVSFDPDGNCQLNLIQDEGSTRSGGS